MNAGSKLSPLMVISCIMISILIIYTIYLVELAFPLDTYTEVFIEIAIAILAGIIFLYSIKPSKPTDPT
jgi:hypothetical protein